MATATITPQKAADLLPKNARQAQRVAQDQSQRPATDDEILGIVAESPTVPREGKRDINWSEIADNADLKANDAAKPGAKTGQDLQETLEASPELKSAWDDAAEYRKTFATPEEARTASTRLADIDRLDALFFSKKPEDHAELARAVAALDPASFNSLATAMAQIVSTSRTGDSRAEQPEKPAKEPQPSSAPSAANSASDQNRVENSALSTTGRKLTPAQTDFFHGANAAAVEEVLHAIETQVDKLLPEEISRSARNRVVGEIYRELDSTLRSNRQLTQQMRDAFRSGALDSEHQQAIVSLVAGRARQALPAVAKRVLNEWTSTIVAANHDRRERQRTAERRIDIAGSGRTGNDGHRQSSPREIDYARMSDADILNL